MINQIFLFLNVPHSGWEKEMQTAKDPVKRKNKTRLETFTGEEELLGPDNLPKISFENKMASLFSEMVGDSKKNQKVLAVILMASAGLFLTLGNSLVRYVYKKNKSMISSFEVLFIRSLIQAFFTVIFMIRGKVHPYGEKKKNLIILIIMGFVEAGAIVLIYLSLERISVGDATVIQFTAPMFTMLFSFIILRVWCSWVEIIFGLLSFLGVVFIAKPSILEGKNSNSVYSHHGHNLKHSPSVGFSSEYVVGTIFALLGAMCLAMFYILNKLSGKKHDVTLTIFYPSIVGIIVSPIVMAIRHEPWHFAEIQAEYWGILVVVGFVAFIGLMFMAEALQLENPGPAVLIRNLDVIDALILQYLLMHTVPSLSSIVGTVIILSCSTIIVLNRVFNLDEKICGKKNCVGYPPVQEENESHDFLLKEEPEEEEIFSR